VDYKRNDLVFIPPGELLRENDIRLLSVREAEWLSHLHLVAEPADLKMSYKLAPSVQPKYSPPSPSLKWCRVLVRGQ